MNDLYLSFVPRSSFGFIFCLDPIEKLCEERVKLELHVIGKACHLLALVDEELPGFILKGLGIKNGNAVFDFFIQLFDADEQGIVTVI